MNWLRNFGWICTIFVIVALWSYADQGKESHIRKGDKINILVEGSGEPVQSYEVSQDGYILVPKIGKISASGKTTAALEEDLREKYSKRFPGSTVSITIGSAVETARNIYILGEVREPGVKPVTQAISVAKAVAMAGGFTEKAELKRIRIIRKSNPQAGELFNWEAYHEGKAPSVEIDPEDIVLVEPRKFSALFILGSVKNPGKYIIAQPISFLEALSIAGGFSSETLSPDITILRAGTNQVISEADVARRLTEVKIASLMLNPGDSLVISISATASTVTIMGAVNTPGKFSIKGTSVDLMQALSLAGGAAQGAGEASIIGKDGSVKTVDLGSLSSFKSTKDLPQLQSGETLIVNRAVPKMIYVLGKVKAPGSFPVMGVVKLHQALSMAGDVTKWGSRNGIRIIRANGKVETFDLEEALGGSDASRIPSIDNGDTVYVP